MFVAHRSVFPKYKAGVSYPEAEFRWSDPEHPNGFIKGYILNAWYRRNSPYLQTSQDTEPAAEVKLDNRIDQNNLQQAGEDSVIVWKNVRVSGHSYSIPKLVPNSTYFFKVIIEYFYLRRYLSAFCSCVTHESIVKQTFYNILSPVRPGLKNASGSKANYGLSKKPPRLSGATASQTKL